MINRLDHILILLRGDFLVSRATRLAGNVRLAAIIILVVAAGVYANALQNDFVFDDTQQVLENRWIRDIRYLPDIFTGSVWNFESDSVVSNYYRPLMHVTYLIAYHLFGPAPWGFHLINILLHAATSVLVLLLARRLLAGTSSTAGDSAMPAFMAALLFATHPIHTEAVTWVAGLHDLLFTFFFLCSLLLYARSKEDRRGAYSLSVLCYALAVLSKEPALTLPVFLFAYDHAFDRTAGHHRRYGKYVPYLIVAGAYLSLRVYALGGISPQGPRIALSAWGYVINVFPLFAQYLEKLLFPIGLNAFHVFHPVAGIGEPRSIVGLAVTAAFIVLLAWVRKKDNLVFFSLLIIALPLAPALYIPAVGVNVFVERYLYLPSVGFALLLAGIFSRLQTARAQYAGILLAAVLVLAAFYGAGTVGRNAVWRNELTLYTDTLNKSPDAVEIRLNLGNVYSDLGYVREAMDQYRKVLERAPGYAEAHNNLGILYYEQGRFREAASEYRTALALKPSYAQAHNNLGNAYAALNLFGEAAAAYSSALTLDPGYAVARRNLEILYQRKKRE